ncbi:MAG TPA: creatininase family protein [Conexibacter sp.]|jgi:creatinine amidohydrolase|nr:creatininase family protein [Conexibacter sp.]
MSPTTRHDSGFEQALQERFGDGDERYYFANLTSADVGRLLADPRPTVLLFPVGSTEPHGPHSPLATDPLISIGMCLRAARRLAHDAEARALILPTLSFGVTRFTKAFPGVIHVEEDTLHAMLVDVCRSLVGQGLCHIVLVNNHFEPEHVQTLHRAMDTVEAETGGVVGYLDLTRRRRAERLTAEVRGGGSHAGQYETSLMLADRPELVDRALLPTLPPTPVNLAAAIAEGCKDFVEMGLPQAYNGTPADAMAAEGEQSFETLTDMLVEQVRELLHGTGGRDVSGLYGRV